MFRYLWKVDICSASLRFKLKVTKDSKQGINVVFVNQGRVNCHHLTQHCSSSTGSYLYGVNRKHHPVHLHLSHHHFHHHPPLPHHLHPGSISPSLSFLASTWFSNLVLKELPSLHAISKHQQPFHTLSQYSLSSCTTSQNRILFRLVLKELPSLHAISKHHQQQFHTLSQYSLSTHTTSKNRLFLSLTQLNKDPYKFSTSHTNKMSTKNKESQSKGKRKHSEGDEDASKSDEAKDEASPTKKQKTTIGKSEKPKTEPASQKSDSPTKDETTQNKKQKNSVEKSEKPKTESNESKKSDSPTKEQEKTTTVSKDDSKKDGSSDEEEFFSHVAARRTSICPSVAEFKFNKKRVRVLSKVKDCPEDSQGLVYWMSRDQRVQDNWAFLYTQRLALKMEVPFHVCFCLVPKFLEATIRQFSFMLKGLEEVEEECRELKIPFHLLVGYAKDVLPEFVTKNSIGGVVTDFSPLRVPMGWVEDVKNSLPKDVTFCQVDAHNLVPCWEASPKQEYGARTIRNKIHNQLSNYLTEFPPVVRQKYRPKTMPEKVDWQAAEESLEVNRNIRLPEWCQPGTKGGLLTLKSFLNERLKYFGSDRNNPNRNALSNLSPWIHFGQISVQRSILMVMEKKSKHKEGADAFIEEAIIRRELADNFCYYNKKYDKIEGAYDWAKESLKLHWDDKRDYIYTREQLEESKTHDDLWNAAQYQMVTEGKMHGFLRMYWAKKILEWTPNPDVALQEAIYLNDKYQLDGRDPNGYVGCMWSICGIHDQGWKERTIFGKIRYMNYDGCKRKFDVPAFVRKYRIKKPLPGKK